VIIRRALDDSSRVNATSTSQVDVSVCVTGDENGKRRAVETSRNNLETGRGPSGGFSGDVYVLAVAEHGLS
jgi:hypothetical protein